MRSGLIFILFLLIVVQGAAQEWSEKAHYDAYMKGDWKQVVDLGKLAKKKGADYYNIRVRNGYAQFQLKKYRKAEVEFDKALKFNSSDAFAKRYGYWSSVYSGNSATALVKSIGFTQAEKDTIKPIDPKWISKISVIGGYRVSTSKSFSVDLPGLETATVNPPGNMPYVSLFLSHQIGRRLTLKHGFNFLEQNRPDAPSPFESTESKVWQIGYLASLNIQVAKYTTVTPSFVMQYWEIGQSKVYDLSSTLAIKQQFGSIDVSLIGGYFEDTDTNKYMVGTSITWYPLHNLKLYSVTSGGYNIGGAAPNPFVRQTIGGNPFKRAWISTSFTWNNRVISFEDVGIGFANNSSDRLNWAWSITPSYFVTEKLGISVMYSVESRHYYLEGGPNPGPVGGETIGEISENYNYHSFYLGLNYKF